ncbi:glycerol-3-phosphate dehydrogenase/oxidase [Citricoccus sp. SGAir0253]|uniref:glycerol-3-phosphate dehydrogenase/oxidase n=1 Tax=Citricoccus sp. SGAir0253 TaxID=2567881 RepID=UPI0010CCBF68|nr:glycerol-3-phosphate dehydrogenase/oxidase [Citricoccus sp. SGAir0253]QCU79310.1 glycerol-3-phosphate dehydrogenase/oxidase [Citricoccus sp. SGAir0253]
MAAGPLPPTAAEPAGALGPAHRERTLAALAATTAADPLDVLVVGGGVVGAGTALDAATRGLSTALVEATDFAWGTSSRSSKLVHGGLRYLEMFDFPLVHEALRERGRLVEDIAPHLVRPVPFLYPLAKAWERAYVGAGVALYDGMAAGRTGHLPVHRHLGHAAVARIAPGLRPDSHLGAIRYYDAQVDDARLVIELVRTAAAHGAHCASRLEVTAYLGTGIAGAVTGVHGVEVLDRETGHRSTVHARRVITATGVWTGEIPVRLPDGGEQALTEGMPRVTAAKGIHLVVPRDRFTSSAGLILRTEKSVLFVIPWGRHWIIGTTDTPWHLGPDRPAATSADIDYVLERANTVLAEPLTRRDVVGVFAGLRPLVVPPGEDRPLGESPTEPASAADRSTARISREHVVVSPVPGLTVVAGGKLTTYRTMAADAVDAAVAAPGAPGTGALTGEDATGAGAGVPGSCTADLPLLGAQGWVPAWNRRTLLARESGLPAAVVESLLHRYGSGAPEVIGLALADPELARELPGLPGSLAAEAVHAVAREGARSVQDVLARRLRAVFEADDAGAAAAGPVARLVAPLLGWDAGRAAAEAERYRHWTRAQRATRQAATDEEAHALLVEAAHGSVRDPDRGGRPTTSEFYAG